MFLQQQIVNGITALVALGRVHGHVGIAQQHVGILAMLRKVNNADAGADINRLFINRDRRLQ